MAIRYECIQGDSFDKDYTSASVTSFIPDWTGKWAIVDKLGDDRQTLASGSLSPSVDGTKMELRILSADTQNITPGDYVLVVQMTNDAIGFNKEITQVKFRITPQGIA